MIVKVFLNRSIHLLTGLSTTASPPTSVACAIFFIGGPFDSLFTTRTNYKLFHSCGCIIWIAIDSPSFHWEPEEGEDFG